MRGKIQCRLMEGMEADDWEKSGRGCSRSGCLNGYEGLPGSGVRRP